MGHRKLSVRVEMQRGCSHDHSAALSTLLFPYCRAVVRVPASNGGWGDWREVEVGVHFINAFHLRFRPFGSERGEHFGDAPSTLLRNDPELLLKNDPLAG